MIIITTRNTAEIAAATIIKTDSSLCLALKRGHINLARLH